MDRLPVEVVACVIAETVSLEDEDREEYKDQLRNLMLTCSQWNSIVDDTPAIWSRIDLEDGRPFMEVALQKSRSYPLNVYYNRRTASFQSEKHLPWFMENIAEHSHRWKNVSLTSWDDLADSIVMASAPMLQSFELAYYGNYAGNGDQRQMLKGPVPLLRRLTIDYFDFGLDPQALTALEYLSITFDYMDNDWVPFEEHAVSSDILAAILRNNPNLREVFLKGHRPEDEDDGWQDFEPDNRDPIDLPQLQTMKLTNMTMPYIRAIVPFLLFPNNHVFSLDVYDSEQFRLVLPLSWSSFGTPGGTNVLIKITESRLRASVVEDQGERVAVDYCYDLDREEPDSDSGEDSDSVRNGFPNLRCISAFLGSLPPLVQSALRISVNLDFAQDSTVKNCLRQMPYLSRLDLLELEEEMLIAFLEFLSGGPDLPFPGLKTLGIELSNEELSAATIEVLLEMLRVRKSDLSISNLESLDIPTFKSSDGVVSRVIEIVGEGVLNPGGCKVEDGEDKGR